MFEDLMPTSSFHRSLLEMSVARAVCCDTGAEVTLFFWLGLVGKYTIILHHITSYYIILHHITMILLYSLPYYYINITIIAIIAIILLSVTSQGCRITTIIRRQAESRDLPWVFSAEKLRTRPGHRRIVPETWSRRPNGTRQGLHGLMLIPSP